MWKRVKSSQLVRVSFFTAISTGIKMIAAFITAKVIAIYLGPSGMGTIGQLNSFVTIILALSTGAINNGVIKYIAEFSEDKQQQRNLIKTALTITLVCSLIATAILVGFSSFWSGYIFNGNTSYRSVFIVFGCTVLLYSLYALFASILNGFKAYKQYNVVNIITSIAGLIFTILLVFYWGIYGALIAVVTYQSVVFFIAAGMLVKSGWFSLKGLFNLEHKDLYIKLFRFSAMSLVSTLCVPYSQILIRNYLTIHEGADVTGFYESMNRISTIYLTMITTTLSVYYLPRLSELSDRSLLRKEIFHGYKVLLPILIIFVIALYLCKDFVIHIAFTSEFIPMRAYFLPQLVGDVFKICSWLLAFMMLAKAMTGLFIITEIVFSITLVLFSILMTKYFGGVGAIYAYAVNYVLYFLVMIFCFRKIVFRIA